MGKSFLKNFRPMRILIDGDACPVKEEIIELAASYQVEVILVASLAHYTRKTYPTHVQVVYVERGAEQADFKIVSLVQTGDLVVTQDYGLASLLLNKATVLHHTGWRYTADNIDQLLWQRHIGKQLRKAGKRTKGPSSFTLEDRERFKQSLVALLRPAEKKEGN